MPLAELPDYKVNQVLFDGATEHEHYIVVDTQYNNRPARILYTDNRTAAQSGLPFDDDPEMLFDYNERFMELVKGLEPKNVLLIGGGVFTLPMAISKWLPDINIDVFEIDGSLLKLASKYFGFKETSHLKVYVGDGRDLLRKTDKKYDLIIVDVFNSIDIPEDYHQPELVRELAAKLSPNGLVAMNVIASYHGIRAEILKKLTKSFDKVMSKTEVLPAGSAMSLWIAQNFIILAGPKAKDSAKYIKYGPIN